MKKSQTRLSVEILHNCATLAGALLFYYFCPVTGESSALWIVPRSAVMEIHEFVDELNRNYHRVDGYPLKEKLKEARERAVSTKRAGALSAGEG